MRRGPLNKAEARLLLMGLLRETGAWWATGFAVRLGWLLWRCGELAREEVVGIFRHGVVAICDAYHAQARGDGSIEIQRRAQQEGARLHWSAGRLAGFGIAVVDGPMDRVPAEAYGRLKPLVDRSIPSIMSSSFMYTRTWGVQRKGGPACIFLYVLGACNTECSPSRVYPRNGLTVMSKN